MKRILLGLFAWLLSAQLAFGALAVSDTASATGSGGSGDITADMPANGVVVVFIAITNTTTPTISGVTSANLTWTKRGAGQTYTVAAGLAIVVQEVWYATSTTAFANEVITVSGSAGNIAMVSLSVTGANTTTPYDTNGAIPSQNTFAANVAPTTNVSTTNANTLIYGFLTTAFNTAGDVGSGFTFLNTSGSVVDVEYKIVSSTQSASAVNWDSGETNPSFASGQISDAIQQAGGGAATVNKNLMMMGVGQ